MTTQPPAVELTLDRIERRPDRTFTAFLSGIGPQVFSVSATPRQILSYVQFKRRIFEATGLRFTYWPVDRDGRDKYQAWHDAVNAATERGRQAQLERAASDSFSGGAL